MFLAGVPLPCAYCGNAMRHLGDEDTSGVDGNPLVRHHYLCPQCGRVWVASPPGQLEPYETGHPTPPGGLPTVNPDDEI